MKVTCLLVWVMSVLTFASVIPSRLRRDHYHEDSRRSSTSQLPKCQLNCDAQFRRDFQAEFTKSYETDYFDFPIDPLISSSKENFNSFCRLVNESMTCYKNECNLKSEDVHSPHSYICLEKRVDFEQSLDCLNKTSRQINCHTGCSRLARRSINSTEEETETRGMIEIDRENFHEQNLRCRFQACALECRSQLISNMCPIDDRPHTLQTVRQYYIADLTSDWHEFQKDEKTHLFSRFCRRMLNHTQNELNNSFYEKTMQQIRDYVRLSVDNC